MPVAREYRTHKAFPGHWLSRGRATLAATHTEFLVEVLRRIGVSPPETGLAALRYWGQTGERIESRVVAADPLHLETGLSRLTAFVPDAGDIADDELRVLFAHLQKEVGDYRGLKFECVGQHGYVLGAEEISAMTVSPAVVHGRAPDEFLPKGEGIDRHHQLLGEMQMALHAHPLNRERVLSGARVINSIWLWGEGRASAIRSTPLPTLFTNDFLFQGYWYSQAAESYGWQDDPRACADIAPDGFIAVAPAMTSDALIEYIDSLRYLLRRGALRSCTLMIGDGRRVEIGRRDELRFWRRLSPLLAPGEANE